jgi:hypothetical protein
MPESAGVQTNEDHHSREPRSCCPDLALVLPVNSTFLALSHSHWWSADGSRQIFCYQTPHLTIALLLLPPFFRIYSFVARTTPSSSPSSIAIYKVDRMYLNYSIQTSNWRARPTSWGTTKVGHQEVVGSTHRAGGPSATNGSDGTGSRIPSQPEN